MVDIPLKSKHAFDKNTLETLNKISVHSVFTNQTIPTLNHKPTMSQNNTKQNGQAIPISSPTITTPFVTPSLQLPTFQNLIQKGQKASLFPSNLSQNISANFGWNTKNSQCDVDVSAFLLGENGKVIGDSWFVFYGQPTSPDNSVILNTTAPYDRETITIHFHKLNPKVQKIVFVLTINEALNQNLHFGMLQDAYIRILTSSYQKELVSFKMTEYYTNVISMMIGEIYNYKGSWKFNAIGNGVARDLAGLCDLYGVAVV